MDWETVFKFVTASVVSIGAGGAIIFALSTWLGKVWANRILSSEKHKLESELEKTKRELDVIKETTLRFQNDKIITYRAIVDVVARILSAFDSHHEYSGPKRPPIPVEAGHPFRLKAATHSGESGHP